MPSAGAQLHARCMALWVYPKDAVQIWSPHFSNLLRCYLCEGWLENHPDTARDSCWIMTGICKPTKHKSSMCWVNTSYRLHVGDPQPSGVLEAWS